MRYRLPRFRTCRSRRPGRCFRFFSNFGVALLLRGANHVDAVGEIVRIEGEQFVAILKGFIVLLLCNVIVDVEIVGDDSHVPLAGASGKFIDQG